MRYFSGVIKAYGTISALWEIPFEELSYSSNCYYFYSFFYFLLKSEQNETFIEILQGDVITAFIQKSCFRSSLHF